MGDYYQVEPSLDRAFRNLTVYCTPGCKHRFLIAYNYYLVMRWDPRARELHIVEHTMTPDHVPAVVGELSALKADDGY